MHKHYKGLLKAYSSRVSYYNDDQMIKFQESASDFYIAAWDDKVQANCWGLLDLANSYLAEE